MKTYKITLLTPKGLFIEIYCDNEPIEDFESRMILKYTTFTTYKSELI